MTKVGSGLRELSLFHLTLEMSKKSTYIKRKCFEGEVDCQNYVLLFYVSKKIFGSKCVHPYEIKTSWSL